MNKKQVLPRAGRSVCLVTNEIFPLSNGGIGRLISNWLEQNAQYENKVSLYLLLPNWLKDKQSDIIHHFGDKIAGLFFVDDVAAQTRQQSTLSNQPLDRWDYLQAYSVSYNYFLALYGLSRLGFVFDIVEFPDYGGWGAVSIEAKRSRLCFLETVLSVRLHSTFGIIRDVETLYHEPSGWSACIVDLEYFALKHADCVVGHIKGIVNYNKEFYHFDQSWADGAIVETPPISVALPADPYSNRTRRKVQNFIFSSRLQPFKRPDLFIKAASVFFLRDKEYDGEALLVSYGWDSEYVRWLESLIPDTLIDKIKVLTNLSSAQRDSLLEGSIIILPSDYESYCLFAYESSLAGNKLLLRRSCLAFGKHDAWVDAENCLMFDDDPHALAECMKAAVGWRPSSKLATVADLPYWHTITLGDQKPSSGAVQLGIIIYGIVTAALMTKALIAVSTMRSYSVILVASGDLASHVGPVFQDMTANVSIHYTEFGNDHLAEVWNLSKQLRESAVCVQYVEDSVDPVFYESASLVLSSDDKIGIFTCSTIIEPGFGDAYVEFAVGEQLSSVNSGMNAIGRVVAFRRNLCEDFVYPHEARQYGWPALFYNIISSGVEVCVVPDVLCSSFSTDNRMAEGKCVATKLSNALRTVRPFVTAAGLNLKASGDLIHTSAGRSQTFALTNESPIQKIWPQRDADWGPVVSFDAHHRGWLVHPLGGDFVVARLRLPHMVRGGEIFVEVHNVNADNDGFRFGVYPGLASWDEGDIKGWVGDQMRQYSSFLVAPNEVKIVNIKVSAALEVVDLYLVSSARPGGSVDNCGAIVKSFGMVSY
ncbi:glycosyltransferase involved in cell wall biosynthesis [Rhizobium sp. PP-F2F-G20b]|nr:glycosyltransferase involved in cell wall biosynthesis [Rhizobium sp. PP-F2F-G20b]